MSSFDRESIRAFFRSRLFMGIVVGIGIALIAVAIFEAGMAVGFHEAQFSARWGENYGRNFGGPGMGMGFEDISRHMPDPHGAFGQIVTISSSTITIANPQKQEQKILITDDTIVRDHEKTISVSTLKTGENVVVLGDPTSDGEVTAKLIRIMPALPMFASSTPTR